MRCSAYICPLAISPVYIIPESNTFTTDQVCSSLQWEKKTAVLQIAHGEMSVQKYCDMVLDSIVIHHTITQSVRVLCYSMRSDKLINYLDAIIATVVILRTLPGTSEVSYSPAHLSWLSKNFQARSNNSFDVIESCKLYGSNCSLSDEKISPRQGHQESNTRCLSLCVWVCREGCAVVCVCAQAGQCGVSYKIILIIYSRQNLSSLRNQQMYIM